MIKKVLLASLLSLGTLFIANAQIAITSDHTKGYFTTKADLTVNADYKTANSVANKFISNYESDLDGLFKWALKGLKMQGEKDNFIMFNIKKHKKQADHISGVMDVDVPIFGKENKNTSYKISLKKKALSDKKFSVQYEMLECEKVFNHVLGTLQVEQIDDKTCKMSFDVKIKLRSPYSLMTKKQYRENIQWRFEKLMFNLKSEMEK